MKKNKTIAYMLAATLLVGGTFLGTKALFTDKLDSIGELAISTGDVDIEVINKGEWKLTRNGSDLKDGTTNIKDESGVDGTVDDGDKDKPNDETPFANNLKMGDSLTKRVVVKNNGTLNAVLELNEIESNGNIPEKLKEIMVLEEVLINSGNTIINNGHVLKPGEIATVELTISLIEQPDQLHSKEDTVETAQSANSDAIEDTVINLTNRWELSAKQVTRDTVIQR